MKHFYLIALLFCNCYIQAQKITNKYIDNELSNYFKKINKTPSDKDYSYDSVEAANDSLANKLQYFTSTYISTLSYSFPTLLTNTEIATSKDNKFRIYSWDTEEGGTMAIYENIWQYKIGNKVYSKIVLDTTDHSQYVYEYITIYTLTAGKKTYYIVLGSGKTATLDVTEQIKIFCIENNSLDDGVKLIKTATNLCNSISVNYTLLQDNDECTIKYDPLKKIISIPIVDENDKFLKRFIRYQFDGKYFKRIANS